MTKESRVIKSPSETLGNKVLVLDDDGVRPGFASRAEWEHAGMHESGALPEVHFADTQEWRTLSVASLKRISFVNSFDPPEREPIRFYDGVCRNDLLWVRLKLREEDWREGFIANTARIFTGQLIELRPSDPESNEHLILFPPGQIEEFQVLGLRAAETGENSIGNVAL